MTAYDIRPSPKVLLKDFLTPLRSFAELRETYSHSAFRKIFFSLSSVMILLRLLQEPIIRTYTYPLETPAL